VGSNKALKEATPHLKKLRKFVEQQLEEKDKKIMSLENQLKETKGA
jgi:hypothetical protein